MSSRVDEIEELIDEVCLRWRLPGFACVVVAGPESRVIVRGCANLADGMPVDEWTNFRVASITKTFTAVAVMQLWENGCFGLDDSVNGHLKAYRLSRDDVTIRHLLTHTGGIGELVRGRDVLRPMAALGMVRHGTTLPSLRDVYGPVQHVATPPGRKWSYANHGYATLGQLVEDVSGQPFPAYMKAHVLEPLGMDRAGFTRDDKTLAVGYRFRRGTPVPVKYMDLTTPAAGSLLCSARDMSAYIAAVSRGGPPLLRPETLDMMLTPQYPAGGELPAMGLGFSLGGNGVAGHGGDLPGFKSDIRIAPGGPGVFVTTNGNRSTNLEFSLVMRGLAERILGRLLPASAETPCPAAEAVPGLYRPSAGLLTNIRPWLMFGGQVEVVTRNGGYALRSPWGLFRKPLTIEGYGHDRFRGERGDLSCDVRFARDDRTTVLHLGSSVGFATLYKRRRRVSVRRPR